MATVTTESRSTRLTLGGLTLLGLAFIYLPPFYLLAISLNSGMQPRLPGFDDLSLVWYQRMLEEGRMLSALQESMIVALIVAVVSAIAATAAALAYLEFRRGRVAWFTFILFSMFVPGVIQGLALSVIFNRMDIVGSTWTVAAGHFLWALPFAFTVVLTNLAVVKQSLILAAYDLGASWWRAFVDVVLPLIRPGIIAAMVFGFLLSFNEYNRAFYLVGRQDTLPIYMFGRMSSGASPTIYALSGSILLASLLCLVAIIVVLSLRQRDDGET